MKFKRLMALVLVACLALEPAAIFAQKGGGGSKGGSSSGGSSGGGVKSGGGSSSGWGGSSGGVKSGGGSSSGWGGSSGGVKSGGSSGGGSSSGGVKSGGGSSSGWGGSGGNKSSGGGSSSGGGGSSSGGSSSGWGGSKDVTTTPKPGVNPASVSKKPVAQSFDKVAIADAKKAESRTNYEKAQTPAPTYRTPKGDTKPIPPKSPETDYLRGRLDESRWVNRTQRSTTFYSGYTGPSYPVVMYSDPFHPMMNYWLLNQSMNNMAMFVLCHEATFREDPARLRDLYAKNAKLEAEVAALKARGTKVDSTWYPPDTDPDLLYNDDYVDGVYNPKPKEVTEYTYDDNGFGAVVGNCFLWVIGIIVTGVFCYGIYRVVRYFLYERRYGQ